MYYTVESSTEIVKAYVFALALFFVLAGFFLVAFLSSGPIILGTEMNANGAVEYLCLGNGCDNLRDFDW